MTRYNFSIMKGDTWSSLVYFKTAAGVAVDITGDTVYFTIKSNPVGDADASALHAQTVTSHQNAAGGISKISITATESAAISVGRYSYDVVWKKADGTVTTLVVGKVSFGQDVTLDD